jgi:hypothetical protein
MTCFLIDPTAKTITAVPCDGGIDAIRQLIGFESIDSDEIDASDDRLFFDEKCFIRQTPGVGRFQLDSLAPVAGMGVVVGAEASAPQVTLQALQERVKFL